jgi:phosphoglycolate phosphatase-like HAD superfamily hydrolase
MPTEHPSRRLILWDVDHTLIAAGDFHTQLYRHAFRQMTGRPPEQLINMSGRTDLESMTTTLRLNQLEPTPEHLHAFASALVSAIEANRELLARSGRQAPGAQAAVRAIAADPSAVQTVVTGNLKPLAVAKLETLDMAAELDFDVGGYGWDNLDRGQLVEAARNRAFDKYATQFTRQNTVVIGDTPKDVAAAHSGGASVIAVATGKSSQDELAQAGADRVLPDLTDLAALQHALDDLAGAHALRP